MVQNLRELVSRQLHLPLDFVRVDAGAESTNNRATILTTYDWLIAVQSQARLDLSSNAGEDDEGAGRLFRELSDADRTRYLAPSTETLPAPWIRVRVVVESKKNNLEEGTPSDGSPLSSTAKDSRCASEFLVIPPRRRHGALHDKNGKCVDPKFLNFSAFLSNYSYENSWKSFDDVIGSGAEARALNCRSAHQRRHSRRRLNRRDALLSTLDALYETPAPASSSLVDERWTDDKPDCSRLQITASHGNLTACICVLDSPAAVFVLLPYAPHSLFHVMTYTQSAMAENHAKGLFVAYQLLKAMDYCQARGVFVGELKLSDVEVDEKLWVKVFPRCVGESLIPVGEDDEEEKVKENEVSSSSKQPLKDLSDDWVHGRLSNFDYLMALNQLAGRVPGDPNNHPIFPWVVDFSAPDAYRDLSKSKYRLNKGDHQLDLMFESQQQQIPVSHVDIGGGNGGGGGGGSSSLQDFPRTPHHISDMLSDITYYVYCARRVDKATLCAHVRSHWVPHEYPSSMRRMYFWTPDECIPEFFTDASIFASIHEDLPDLEIPAWAKSPEDFVAKHRRILEGNYVSKHLHRWIDLTFGYMLTGPAAVANKNVCLQLVDGHEEFTAHGVVQLFTHPHPQKLVDSYATKRPSYLESMAWNDLETADELPNLTTKTSNMTLSTSGVDGLVNAHGDAAADDSLFSSDKKSSKSPKDDTWKKQQQKWLAKKIVLPDGYNPVARLEAIENLHQFITKNLHEMEEGKTMKRGIDQEGLVETHEAFTKRMTKKDVTAFAVVIAEMFLAKRLRFQIGDLARSLEEREAVVKSVCRERFHDIPRPFRRLLKKVLRLEDADTEDFLGLPLSPDLLLHPMVELIPFPPIFPSLYNFLSELTALSERSRQIRLRIHFQRQQEQSNSFLLKSIARQKVDLCCTTLKPLLPKLSAECLEIVLPHLKDLLEDADTAVAAAWHLYGSVAACFGPEKTIKHFLGPMIKIFQQDEKTTTAKHMKLYHRAYILQLIVGFGLNTFLNSFSTLMVEATAGFKNFVDEECVEKVESDEALELVGDDNDDDDDEDRRSERESLELTRSSEGEGVSFDLHAEGDSASPLALERSGGGESTSLTSVSDVFDGARMGPILEADLASLEGEMCSQVDESEDEERERDCLTVVDNADSEDDQEEEGRIGLGQLGTSVHSLSRLAHYKADKGKRGNEKISDVSSIASGDLYQETPALMEEEAVTAASESQQQQQRPQSSSLRSSGGRSSGLSADQCNIADVSSETIKWLASRLGPVLTTKYLSGNLLKMLSLCYLGVEQLQPTSVNSNEEEGSALRVAGSSNATLNYAVKGDANARHVLDAISTIAIYYGEQIILLHYFPYLADLIASSAKKRRLHVRAEAGLVSAMVLLRHCLPLLGDQTLMDYLPDVVFKDILEKLVVLISNVRIAFPSGALARSVICYKIIDVMVMVSLRIGFEMTRKMMTTLLKRFFACFDVVHSTEDAGERESSSTLTSPRTPSMEASLYVELKKDSVTDELVAGTPFQLKIQSPTLPGPSTEMATATSKHTRSSSLYSLSALTMEPREGEEGEEDEESITEKGKESSSPSSGADMDSPSEDEERNKAELKQVG